MDVANVIIQSLSVAASFGVIAMTYHVYKISYRHTQIDNYLKQIVNLYYKIEDASKQLYSNNLSRVEEKDINCLFREIRVDCTLMLYYLKKYPGFYGNRTRFEVLLNEIIENPEVEIYYDYLSNAFRDFCLNKKKDSKGEPIHIYINGKEDGLPDKDI
jgi:hypothetical protein